MIPMLEPSQQADTDPAANYPSADSDVSTRLNQNPDEPDSSSEDDECPVPLDEVQKPIRFKTATTYWSKSHSDFPTVDVEGTSGQELASLPLKFLLEGHGKIIPREVFGDDPPDSRLLDWHYQQCVIKHLRGFTAGRLPCDLENLRWACYEGEDQLLDEATPNDRW